MNISKEVRIVRGRFQTEYRLTEQFKKVEKKVVIALIGIFLVSAIVVGWTHYNRDHLPTVDPIAHLILSWEE